MLAGAHVQTGVANDLAAIPSGFMPFSSQAGALEALGNFFARPITGGFQVGLLVTSRHTNSRGTLHGGVLATLSDIGLGYAIAAAHEPPLKGVTTNLTIDYAAPVPVGSWLHVVVDQQVRAGRNVIATGRVMHADRVVAVIRGTFLSKADNATP